MMSNMSVMSDDTASVSSLSVEAEPHSTNQMEDVLVISLGDESECPGMLTEQKVPLRFNIIKFRVRLFVFDTLNSLSYVVGSESIITPYIKINNPLVD